MDPRDRLFGEIALQLQLLTREQMAECTLAQHGEHSGRTLPEVAIALGHMSRADADLVVARQNKLMAKRRGTLKHVPQVEEVIEQRAPRRDHRADTTTPMILEPELLPPAPAGAPDAKRRTHSMQMGSTLNAVPAPDLQFPKSPNPPMELAETKPGNDPDDPLAKVAMALADTRPGSGKDVQPTASAAASPDEYDFGDHPQPAGATMIGTGAQRRLPPATNTGNTIEQPSGAATRRAPKDRAWRNPSRPPEEAPPPSAAGQRSGAHKATLVGNASVPVKPPPVTNDARYLDRVLGLAMESGATDLHAHSDAPLLARVDGMLMPLSGDAPLARAAAERVIAEVMTEAQWQTLAADGQVRFTYELPGVGRFRGQVFREVHGIGAAFRILPPHAKSLDELGLPHRLLRELDPPRGLVLCTGPRGSGKTSTAAALLAAVTDTRALHGMSVECPTELLVPPTRGTLTAVEVPTHVPSFSAAVSQALALGVQVIALSDLAASATVLSALEAALAGACVIACVSANDGAGAIEQVLGRVTTAERAHAREALAETVRLVLNQRLVVQAVGHGRVAALEVLSGTPQLAALIREDKLHQLAPLMASGKAAGMLSLDDALDALVQAGTVSTAEARRVAHKKERFRP